MMIRKQLTETEAWSRIARRIASGRWGRRGLCNEVSRLSISGAVDLQTKEAMYDRISDHMGDFRSSGEYDHTGYYDTAGEPDARVFAALILALQTEEVAS